MMVINILFWALIGAFTGFLYFKSQQWSVDRITPLNRSRSLWLIVGGAVLRWLFFGIVLSIAISHSYLSLLSLFVSFMFVRFSFLLSWQGWLSIKRPFIRNY